MIRLGGEGLEGTDREGDGAVAVVLGGVDVGGEGPAALPEHEVLGDLHEVSDFAGILADAEAERGLIDSAIVHDRRRGEGGLGAEGEIGTDRIGEQVGQ